MQGLIRLAVTMRFYAKMIAIPFAISIHAMRCLSICLSVYLSICLSVYLSIKSMIILPYTVNL